MRVLRCCPTRMRRHHQGGPLTGPCLRQRSDGRCRLYAWRWLPWMHTAAGQAILQIKNIFVRKRNARQGALCACRHGQGVHHTRSLRAQGLGALQLGMQGLLGRQMSSTNLGLKLHQAVRQHHGMRTS